MLRNMIIYGCVVAAGMLSPFPAGSGTSRQIATDEAFVAKQYDDCAAFTPSPHHCLFAVATTSNRAGGHLYGIELVAQTGDDCYRGTVYFFDRTRFIARTSSLPPYSIGGVKAIRADGAGRFSVVYLVNKDKDTSCAAGGDAGTDTYVYRWTGSHMAKESGTLPRPPEVILGGRGRRPGSAASRFVTGCAALRAAWPTDGGRLV
jgi:hypothetical protein